MKFPKEYLEEIKQRVKVSDIVGATVQLKRRGREFVGLSPFSKEKTQVKSITWVLVWWSWGDLNPRPQAFSAQFYMCSRLI